MHSVAPMEKLEKAPLELEANPTPQVRVCRWLYEGPRKSWPATAHPTIELAIVRKGAVAYRIGQKEHILSFESAMIVPAEVEHASVLEPETRAISLHLVVDLAAEIACAMGRNLAREAVLVAGARRLSTLIGLLEGEAERSDAGSVLASDALAEAIAVEVLRAEEEPAAGHCTKDRRILAAVQKIESDYAESLTVDGLAKVARMSRFHFSREFHAQVGKSPYRFLIDTRIARAMEILRSGRTSVTEAALSVGFQDLGRFSREFRQKTGTSPGAWRAGVKGSARPPLHEARNA